MSNRTTFRKGDIAGVTIRPLKLHADTRGWLCELFRADELPGEFQPVMAYVSETLPGVVRGPHEHVRQTDYFALIGPGDFRLYMWDNRVNSSTYRTRQIVSMGERHRRCVIIPPGVVHAYENVSDKPGWVFNAPNALYAGPGKSEPVDEVRHEDDAGNRLCRLVIFSLCRDSVRNDDSRHGCAGTIGF